MHAPVGKEITIKIMRCATLKKSVCDNACKCQDQNYPIQGVHEKYLVKKLKKIMSRIKKIITNAYHCLQLLNMGILSFSWSI
jgi:hypothetical protein